MSVKFHKFDSSKSRGTKYLSKTLLQVFLGFPMQLQVASSLFGSQKMKTFSGMLFGREATGKIFVLIHFFTKSFFVFDSAKNWAPNEVSKFTQPSIHFFVFELSFSGCPNIKWKPCKAIWKVPGENSKWNASPSLPHKCHFFPSLDTHFTLLSSLFFERIFGFMPQKQIQFCFTKTFLPSGKILSS